MFDIVALLPRLVGSREMASLWVEKALGDMAQYYDTQHMVGELYVRCEEGSPVRTLLADNTRFWEIAVENELID